jgi:Flp pilus assembly protein TadB
MNAHNEQGLSVRRVALVFLLSTAATATVLSLIKLRGDTCTVTISMAAAMAATFGWWASHRRRARRILR